MAILREFSKKNFCVDYVNVPEKTREKIDKESLNTKKINNINSELSENEKCQVVMILSSIIVGIIFFLICTSDEFNDFLGTIIIYIVGILFVIGIFIIIISFIGLTGSTIGVFIYELFFSKKDK